MGYIGNEPTTGHFPVDNFTSSGGSTYTLTRAPASAGAIEVSVQGVLQPTTAYTVSGSTLTMAGVTTGVKIFVRHLGETLSLPTPADGSVTTAKLGTNSVDGTKIAMGSDARGDILYHGATDYARLAKGSSGQVLTMGANDPAWAAGGGGTWTLIGTSVASDSASLTVTGLDSTYDTYAMAGSDIVPATDSTQGYLRVGDSGGVDSGASDYGWVVGSPIWTAGNNYAGSASTSAAQIQVINNVGTGTGEVGGFMCYLHMPADSTKYPLISGTYANLTLAGALQVGFCGGVRLSSITLDRINIFMSSGNIASGRLTVWGIGHA